MAECGCRVAPSASPAAVPMGAGDVWAVIHGPHVVELSTALQNANRMIGEQATEFAGIKERLETRCTRLREALAAYGRHDESCILSQYQAGRPTDDGGYEMLYGFGQRKQWYRVEPTGDLPPCECGFDAALAEPPDA